METVEVFKKIMVLEQEEKLEEKYIDPPQWRVEEHTLK